MAALTPVEAAGHDLSRVRRRRWSDVVELRVLPYRTSHSIVAPLSQARSTIRQRGSGGRRRTRGTDRHTFGAQTRSSTRRHWTGSHPW